MKCQGVSGVPCPVKTQIYFYPMMPKYEILQLHICGFAADYPTNTFSFFAQFIVSNS